MKNSQVFCIMVLTVLFSMASMGARAQEHAEETGKSELALEFLKLSKFEQTLDATIDAYAQSFGKGNAEVEEKMKTFFSSYMSWQKLKNPLIDLVSRIFTEKELQDVNAFYRTESGKKYAEKSPLLSAEISKLISNNMKGAMRDMQEQSRQKQP